MKLGIYFDMRNPPKWGRPSAQLYGQTLEQIEEAETLGIDYVWFSEHHFFEDGYLPQTLTMAAAAAARTSQIRIGTAVLLAPLKPAVHIAEEAAIVDILSDGRLELGLGAGYVASEFEAYGADLKTRFDTCDERVREIRELLAEKITPKPVQDSLPIWLGYMGPKGAKRAGRLGCGLLTNAHLEPYLEGLAEGGYSKDAAKMSGLLWMVVSSDPEAAFEKILPHYAWQLNSYAQAQIGAQAEARTQAEGSTKNNPLTVEKLQKLGRKPDRSGSLQVLTPDEAVEHIKRETEGLPVVEMHAWASIAGMDDSLVAEHINLLATQVTPQIKSNPK